MTRFLVFLAVWSAALASTAHAVIIKGGGDTGTGGNTVVHIKVGNPGTGTGGEPEDASDRPVVQYTWTIETDPAVTGSTAGLCNAAESIADPPIPGFNYHYIGTDATGTIVDDRFVCIPIVIGGDPAAPPPAPPIPAVPTFGEAWASARVPGPTVVLDPETRGITGLDTLISTTGPTTLVINAIVRGYTIVGTVTLDHYTIAVDDQPPTDANTGHFTFETKGNHTIAISTIWHGTSTITGPDIAPIIDLDIGTATITSTRTYPVHEIRSVLKR